jgi:hypothetical protein
MKKLPIFLLTLILLATNGLRAQVSNFVFFPHSLLGAKTNIPAGLIVPDSISLKNNGPAIYSGFIGAYTFLEDSASPTQLTLISTDTFGFFSNIQVSQILNFHLTQTYTVTSQGGHYRIGNNVIVIWPILSNGGMSRDTLRDTVFILNSYVGINKLNVTNLFNLYPNPAHSVFSIGNESPGIRLVEEVRILDLKGRLVRNFLKQDVVDVGDLPKGIYLVEVLFSNGSVGRRKLMME